MKKIFLFLCLFLLSVSCVFAEQKTIEAGISIEHVPQNFYGTWRVSSHIIDSNSPETFKQKSVDLWNLSRSGNVIKLENPFSGAQASIVIRDLKGNYIRFQKIGNYDNQKLTDVVNIVLNKDTFSGENDLKMDTISDIDGHVIKTQWAKYKIKGEKISGTSIK